MTPLRPVTLRDPLCECGERESEHPVTRAGRGACTYMDAARTCRCPRFRPQEAGGQPGRNTL